LFWVVPKRLEGLEGSVGQERKIESGREGILER
jgi:hypothetical protein